MDVLIIFNFIYEEVDAFPGNLRKAFSGIIVGLIVKLFWVIVTFLNRKKVQNLVK